QGGDAKTFHVALILVCGFNLTDDEAMPLFLEWNKTCVPTWDEKELRRKLRYASNTKLPRGYLLDDVHEAVDDPFRLARLFLERHYTTGSGLSLHYWQSEWHAWNGRCYEGVSEDELRAVLGTMIKAEFDDRCRSRARQQDRQEDSDAREIK